MGFPIHRLRRLRQHASLRRMVRETQLTPADLIYPLFVTFGENKQELIASMPGNIVGQWISLFRKPAMPGP